MDKITPLKIPDAIRKRPGMYVGGVGPHGVETLIDELLVNSIDEFLAGRAREINVSLNPDHIVISDDGAGLEIEPGPGKSIQGRGLKYFTDIHFSPTADGHAPHVHLNYLHGVGLAVVNALSENLTVHAWRNQTLWSASFHKGILLGQPKAIEHGNGKGTRISFNPDPEIFGGSRPRFPIVRATLFDTAHLFPGLNVSLNEEKFFAPGGLADLLPILGKTETVGSTWSPFYVYGKHENVEIQVALSSPFHYDSTSWCSWANGVRTDGNGDHVAGVQDALRSIGKARPSNGLIHVIMHEPQYAGPTKACLAMPHVRKAVRECLKPKLKKYYSSIKKRGNR